MDYYFQRERKRIDNILNKFTCNHSLPISLAKQSMNKLTRHKKVYSFEADSEKDPLASVRSVKDFLIKKTEIRSKDGKYDFSDQEERSQKSIQHTFTFQTLREVLAMNPDVTQINKNLIHERESRKRNKKKHQKKSQSECNEKNKVIYLPTVNENAAGSGKNSSFLREFPNNRIKKIITCGIEERNRNQKLKGSFLRDNSTKNSNYEDDINKIHILYGNEIFVNSNNRNLFGSKIREPKIERKNFGETEHIKAINITLPKAVKASYLSELKQNALRRYLEDDSSVRGWDKITPLDHLET